MEEKRISVAEDFDKHTGLRHCDISDNSGEEFYHKILNKAFKEVLDDEQKKLVVNLDYTAGYAPSFIDEAFGRLVYDFGRNLVEEKLEVISEEVPDWKDMLKEETYIQWEKRRNKKDEYKITDNHDEWWHKEKGGELTKVRRNPKVK